MLEVGAIPAPDAGHALKMDSKTKVWSCPENGQQE
jgi:hypothetical protein